MWDFDPSQPVGPRPIIAIESHRYHQRPQDEGCEIGFPNPLVISDGEGKLSYQQPGQIGPTLFASHVYEIYNIWHRIPNEDAVGIQAPGALEHWQERNASQGDVGQSRNTMLPTFGAVKQEYRNSNKDFPRERLNRASRMSRRNLQEKQPVRTASPRRPPLQFYSAETQCDGKQTPRQALLAEIRRFGVWQGNLRRPGGRK